MTKSVENMRLSGGHPVLDFVNTVDSRRNRWGPDLLQRFDDLVEFCLRVALVTEDQSKILRSSAKSSETSAVNALKIAIDLRESCYRVFLAEDRGGDLLHDDVAYLEAAATTARTHQMFRRQFNGWAWIQRMETPFDLVDALSSSAADLLATRSERRPVKECKGDNCGWLFLDHSKGGRRIWCSEASCGVHSRVKKFRRQQ